MLRRWLEVLTNEAPSNPDFPSLWKATGAGIQLGLPTPAQSLVYPKDGAPCGLKEL